LQHMSSFKPSCINTHVLCAIAYANVQCKSIDVSSVIHSRRNKRNAVGEG
jgi:hypothetical protein